MWRWTACPACSPPRTLDASLRGRAADHRGILPRRPGLHPDAHGGTAHGWVMTFEWTSARKRSIQQAVSGTRLERFPLLRRCMSEQAPVFLSRQAPIDLDGESEETAPLVFHGSAPDPGPTDRGLPVHRKRPGAPGGRGPLQHPDPPSCSSSGSGSAGRERSAGAAEQLMDLPDLRAYTQALCTLTSEHYSSLGAGVPGYPGLRRDQQRPRV